MIRVENLCKSFNTLNVLKEVNYTFKEGLTTVILGSSGSGKSTLLRCINHLEIPTSGNIYYQNELIDKKNIHLIRQDMSMVFQNFNLFSNMNVTKNITYALNVVKKLDKFEQKKKAMHYLELVGLIDKKDVYPSKLSGGQKQRIAIARSLALEPKVFLFDEPTSALDPEMVNEVLDVMRKITKNGYTNIIVTHEMGFAREVADEIVFMSDGRIIESNDKTSFFTNPRTSEAQKFLAKIL